MSQRESNGENKIEVFELVRNQVAAAGAIAPNRQAQPSVFKLDADCWDEVFDCLSFEDVHSFGQTCKAFQRVTGEYFEWMYVNVIARCKIDGIYIDGKQMNGFSAFVQKIYFGPNTTNSMLRFVESNCKAVKKMTFAYGNFTRLNSDLLRSILTKLEVLEISCCQFDRDSFEALIESCVKIKRLYVWHVGLPVRKHSTVEHLKFFSYETKTGNDGLKTFLEQSPKLRSLETDASLLYKNRESILNANVQSNDLTIQLFGDFKDGVAAFILFLNELRQRRFYKHLHLFSHVRLSPDQLLALPGLVTLNHHGWKAEYPLLVNIKEFVITWDIKPYIDPTAFINVEYLLTFSANIEFILPCVRYLLKLKAIYISLFEEKVLDIRALNKERKKLLGSRKVSIYVDEKTYLATKWASKGTTFDLIEIRCRTSYSINRPYRLWWNVFDYPV